MVSIAQYLPYIFIALLFFLWVTKKQNEALYSGYATTFAVGINLFIGLLYFHPRPFMDSLGVALLAHKPENSFPSDHTTFVLSIAFMLLNFKSTRIVGVFASILAFISGFARVYSGVHYPFDIFGSIVISIISVVIIYLLRDKLSILNNYIIAVYNKLIGILINRL